MKLNPISSMSTTMNPEFSVRQPVHTSLNLSRTMALVCLTAFALAGAAYAQTSAATPAPAMPADHGSHAGHAAHMGHSAADSASDKAAAPSADAAQVMTDGEVRRWDAATGKLTLRHSAIANLNMPAMTMVFQLKDKAAGDALSVGQRVRFHAEREGGALTITRIEAQP